MTTKKSVSKLTGKPEETMMFIGRMESQAERAPIKIDIVGASDINKLTQMRRVIESASVASAAIYLRGTPTEIASTLLQLASKKRFDQVNAALSLRGHDLKGKQ